MLTKNQTVVHPLVKGLCNWPSIVYVSQQCDFQMRMDISHDNFYILDEYGKLHKTLGSQDFDTGCSVQHPGHCWIGPWSGILKKRIHVHMNSVKYNLYMCESFI